MKIEFTKEWCLKGAELEHATGADIMLDQQLPAAHAESKAQQEEGIKPTLSSLMVRTDTRAPTGFISSDWAQTGRTREKFHGQNIREKFNVHNTVGSYTAEIDAWNAAVELRRAVQKGNKQLVAVAAPTVLQHEP